MDLYAYFQKMTELAAAGNVKGLWFWISIFWFLACLYSMFYQLRLSRWPSVIGKLNFADISLFGALEGDVSERNYHVDVEYNYTVDGRNYKGTRVSAWYLQTNNSLRVLLEKQLDRIETRKDMEVKVYYSSRNPQKSFLLIPTWKGIFFVFVLGMLPAIGFYFRFYH